MSKWQGTPVPNTGYVENVYFNTALSIEEVENYLSKLSYIKTDFAKNKVSPLLCSTQPNIIIFALVLETGNHLICTAEDLTNGNYEIIYDYGNGFKIDVLNINNNLTSELLTIPIGTQNNLLSSLFSITPFVEVQEKVTLNSFLKSIADAIRSKKGTTDKINASNFASEIASITGGGGAVIKTKGDWVGTAVPESGLVDKVYFNTSLSVDEVVEIAKNRNYLLYDGMYVSVCFTDATMQKVIVIIKVPANTFGNAEDTYLIQVAFDQENLYYFQTFDVNGEGWVGWNPNIAGVVDVNMENMLSAIAPQVGYIPENNNLSKIFSITPFVKSSGESVSLSGEYDGTPITIEKLKGGWKGTAVPSSGQVDKIYINTKLSKEEVVNICDNLTFVDGSSVTTGFDIWSCATNSALTNGIMVARSKNNPEIYAITVTSSDGVNEIFFSTIGWTESASDVFAFNDNNQISVVGPMLGLTPENEKASSLFSSTPFVEKKANVLYLKDYIENQQIPLEINVKVRSGNVVIANDANWIGTQVPTTGYVENVYFNTALSVEDTYKIITDAKFTVNEMYPILCTSNKSITLAVWNIGGGNFAIIDVKTFFVYFHNITDANTAQSFGFTAGWNPNITMPIAINSEVIDVVDGITITNLDILSSLFSTTPFELGDKEIIAELGGEYAPKNINVSEDGTIDVLEMLETDEVFPVKIIASSVKNFISGYIIEFNNTSLDKLRIGAFAESDVVNVNIPKVDKIPDYAFYQCYDLETINCPKVYSIGERAFERCYKLTTTDFPEVNYLGEFAFYLCEEITNVNFPQLSNIQKYALSGCKKITNVDFPLLTSIDENAFSSCYNLTSAILPKADRIEASAFSGCYKLTNVDFTSVKSIYDNAFSNCTKLNNIKFPNLTSIRGKYIFSNCSVLTDVYFGKFAKFTNIDFFVTDILKETLITIHVRSEHLEQYTTDTNWKQLINVGKVAFVGDYTD